MQLLNATRMQAGYTMGMRPDGRELLVVVVKGTFDFPRGTEALRLADEQAPLADADVFTGEPGYSAPLYESDFAPTKTRCDVLLNGSAYAPRGRPTERVRVGLRVGSMYKEFDVVGNRYWQVDFGIIAATPPEPFTVMPISYDNAFGGVDRSHPDESRHRCYLENHAGRGFHDHLDAALVDGRPLPNTEEPGDPVTSPSGGYRPMAFGAVGRAWKPRPKFAGTYDERWLKNVFPFLPADFDERYYQAAPSNQWIDHPRGGEVVELLNLTPEGWTGWSLPSIPMPVTFYHTRNGETTVAAVIDTIVIEPDRRRVMIVWRASLPLRRNMYEVRQSVAGEVTRGWRRARAAGKPYYRSIDEAVAASRAAATDARPAGAADTGV